MNCFKSGTISTSLLALGLMVSCGGQGSTPPPGGMEAEDFLAALEDANCMYEVNCGVLPVDTNCAGGYIDYDLATIRAELQAGHSSFDSARASSCLEIYSDRAISCSSAEVFYGAARSACDAVITGHVDVGGACYISQQCADGLYCRQTLCSGPGCCQGICASSRRGVTIGESCKGDVICVDGAFCDVSSAAGVICAPQVTTAGVHCYSSRQCAAPLFCIHNIFADTDGCQGIARTGDSCSPASTNVCSDDRDYCSTASMTCVPKGQIGEPCPQPEVPDQRTCVAYAKCDAVTNKCKSLGNVGESCESGNDSDCLPALFCDAKTHTCQINNPIPPTPCTGG